MTDDSHDTSRAEDAEPAVADPPRPLDDLPEAVVYRPKRRRLPEDSDDEPKSA